MRALHSPTVRRAPHRHRPVNAGVPRPHTQARVVGMGLSPSSHIERRCERRGCSRACISAYRRGRKTELWAWERRLQRRQRRSIRWVASRGRCRGGSCARPALPTLPYTRTGEGGLTTVLTGRCGGVQGTPVLDASWRAVGRFMSPASPVLDHVQPDWASGFGSSVLGGSHVAAGDAEVSARTVRCRTSDYLLTARLAWQYGVGRTDQRGPLWFSRSCGWAVTRLDRRTTMHMTVPTTTAVGAR
jgi:hypothetical protein